MSNPKKTLVGLVLICAYGNLLKANEGGDCHCDFLQIRYCDATYNHFDFIKQSSEINRQPFYFSKNKQHILWWSESKSSWMGHTSNDSSNIFRSNIQIRRNHSCTSFLSRKDWTHFGVVRNGEIEARCLTFDNDCYGQREESGLISEKDQNQTSDLIPFNATSKIACKFPFVYQGKEYNSCTKDGFNISWCATAIKSTTLEWKDWGNCNESCLNKNIFDKPWAIVLIVGIAVSFLSFVAIGYIYIKRREKKIELEAQNGNSKNEFDVFISYSHPDKYFAEEFLASKLESIKYKCILQVRDFLPGISIMDQIEQAVQSSSCTMIILSKDFLKSQWACNG